MMHPSGTRVSSWREPEATTKTRQVRALCNILINNDFMYLSSNCVNSWMTQIREFTQSSLINVENHGVVSER